MFAGLLLSGLMVYATGRWLVPAFDPLDKSILAACNPDNYTPGLDQFMRAWTDYLNFLISTPTISWIVAYGLYRLMPRYKVVVTGLLAVETLVFAVLAAMGKIWPNKTYVGPNVMFVIGILAVFGGAAYLFHRMDRDALRRFSRALMLVFLSGYLTGYFATNKVKSAVARPRPLNDANRPWNEQVRTIPDEVLRGRNSFPSGHTSGTFALITPLFWYTRNRKARTGLLGLGVLQGFSRVYTAAHFPFCCLMAGVMGFLNGTIIFFALGGPSLRSPLPSEPAKAPSTRTPSTRTPSARTPSAEASAI